MFKQILAFLYALFLSVVLVACESDSDGGGSTTNSSGGSGSGTCNITDQFTPGGSVTVSVNGIDQLGNWEPVAGTYQNFLPPTPGAQSVDTIIFDNLTNVTPAPEVPIVLTVQAVSNCQLTSVSLNYSNFSYLLTCQGLNACAGVNLDKSNGQVSFSNAMLSNAANAGGPPAVVNGTLTW